MWMLCDKIIAGKPETLWVNLAKISAVEAERTIVKIYGYENRPDLNNDLKVSPKRLKEDKEKYQV